MRTAINTIALLALCTPALANTPVYDQLTGFSPGSVWGSQLNSDPVRNFRSFDNFTLSADAQITSVDWNGYLDEGLGDDGLQYATLDTISGFQVTFYDNTGTFGPGAAIADQFIPSALITQTNAGTVNSIYSAPISPVALLAGEQYWFSVAAVLPNPDAPVLLWQGGAEASPLGPGDSTSALDAGVDGVVDGLRRVDLLFRLNAVPAPGAASLLGLAMLTGARRRRA